MGVPVAQLSALGASFRAARRPRWSQAALGTSAGIGVAAVRNLERGRGTLRTWTAALGVVGIEIRGRSLAAGPVGAALAGLRQRRGLSRRALARMLGVSRATLAVLEAGGPGRLETLEAYGAAVGAGLYLAPIGAAAGFYASAGNSSAHHGWETPPELVAALEQVFGRFDLDPCAASADAGKVRMRARVRLTMRDDGLGQPWRGRVFVNPPYGRQLGAWVTKCAAEASAGALVVGLVPARTDTRWWHAHIAGTADVFMLRGRLRFGDGTTPAPFPSAVVVWGGSLADAGMLGLALPGCWHVPRSNREAPERPRFPIAP